MKQALKKISDVCKLIFGYGIMITLLVGGATFLGYLVAFIVGGEAAAAICTFVYKKIIPVMIYINGCMVIFGLVCMYLAGEKALTSNKKKSSKEGER